MATDKPMQLGMIGLGRMGSNLVRRLMRDGHRCVVYDVSADAVKGLEAEGADGCHGPGGFRRQAGEAARDVAHGAGRDRRSPRWTSSSRCSRPATSSSTAATPTTATTSSAPRRSRPAAIHYIDCGTSGGVWGLERGFCLMIGGEDEPVARLDPIFKTIAPGQGDALPTPSRTEERSTAAEGYLHCGPNGAGHFVKMVHNGIEYGMMAAIAEGLSIIEHADAGKHMDEIDAETTPLRDPWAYQYTIDVGRGRRGVAARVGHQLLADRPDRRRVRQVPDLSDYAGRVSDSGEGRWTVQAAIDDGVPVAFHHGRAVRALRVAR